MARITSVLAGLVLGLMCLAFSAAAAPPERLIFDSGPGLELLADPAIADMDVMVEAIDLAVPLLAATASDVEPLNCLTSPAWAAVPLTPGGYAADNLPACTARRYDPGWLDS